MKKERPDLTDKMTRNFGFAMGIEFRDASLSIAANSTAVAKKDMVFNVNLGISNLTNKDASDNKGKDIALFIGEIISADATFPTVLRMRTVLFFFLGDTVHVHSDGPATLLTTSKKKIKNIAIFLKDADSEEEEKENKLNQLPDPENFGRGKRTAVLEQKLRQDTTAEERRKLHQKVNS